MSLELKLLTPSHRVHKKRHPKQLLINSIIRLSQFRDIEAPVGGGLDGKSVCSGQEINKNQLDAATQNNRKREQEDLVGIENYGDGQEKNFLPKSLTSKCLIISHVKTVTKWKVRHGQVTRNKKLLWCALMAYGSTELGSIGACYHW